MSDVDRGGNQDVMASGGTVKKLVGFMLFSPNKKVVENVV